MNSDFRSENAARIALARWLSSGVRAQKAFLSALPELLRKDLNLSVPFSVEQEHPTDTDKRIDILLVSGNRAICIELKIDHRENPFQYVMYRRYLERCGFQATVLGVTPRRLRTRGREALNTAILDWLADFRMTWAELAKAVQRQNGSALFLNALRAIDPVLLVDLKEPLTQKIGEAKIAMIDEDPHHLAAFFGQLISSLPGVVSAYPDQAGSSPPLLRFGRKHWANFLGDDDRERIFLEVDIPRRSKPLPETQFHFGIVLWSKTSSGKRRIDDVERILYLAHYLAKRGFVFQRNLPGKYPPVDWNPNHGLDSVGLYYLNASDHRNFCMRKSEAVLLGTNGAISRMADEALRIIQILDAAMAEA